MPEPKRTRRDGTLWGKPLERAIQEQQAADRIVAMVERTAHGKYLKARWGHLKND
jgi:hypothetical protein